MRVHMLRNSRFIRSSFVSLLLVLVLLAAALLSTGCAPAIRQSSAEVAKGAVPATVETTLNKMDEPRTRQQIALIVGSPEMKRAVADLSESFTEGMGDGLGSDAMAANMTKLVRELTRAFTLALAESVRGYAPAMQKAITQDLGPAISDTLHKELAPGVASMLDAPELQAALGQTTREVAHQAVLGSNEGLAEVAEKQKHDEGRQPLGTVARFLTSNMWLVIAIPAAIIVGLLLWMLKQLREMRLRLEHTNGAAAHAA
jgi:hypothetical protein